MFRGFFELGGAPGPGETVPPVVGAVRTSDLQAKRLQDEATPETLGADVLHWLRDDAGRERLVARFTELHRTLRRDADERAAEAVAGLLKRRTG